ncbi:substrate-binding periplasmic protein [Lichenifustis flavocetrariae]|uniref:Transporter substrate-binding domain-containing protein n=1 Tax=Lichenifustis flavocetrariae TaxID=2949735 RepID=A0AA41Z1Q7_9HYPH|nr:transporter substrate-binding domain-containing protein [Lichenifustis flavocetrariae]MCW6511235.1 transporter substrate-binding domain-containing protein [Lichenifustis flavocetrariae]
MSVRSTMTAALFLAALSATAQAQSCTPKHTFTTVEAGFITVGASTYAPYSLINADGVLVGIDGDIMAEIAKLECLKVKPVVADGGSGIQYVLSKKADTTTGDWYRTAERARVVYLTAPLYVDQMAVYSKQGYDSIGQMEGKVIGSTSGNLWNADMKKVFGDKVKLYQTSVAMQQDLMAGRVDLGVDGESIGVVAQQQGQLPGIKIVGIKPDPRVAASQEAGQGTFPMTKDNTAMGKAFDEDIEQLHKDGTIGKLLAKYGLSESAATTGAPRLIK